MIYISKIHFYSLLFMLFIVTITSRCYAIDNLTSSMRTSASGIKIQTQRLKIIAENMTNADTTGTNPDEMPYRRKIISIQNKYDPVQKANVVSLDRVVQDKKTPFIIKYQPGHPASDQDGYVVYPNVSMATEMVDMKEAERTMDANMNALEIAKRNQQKLIEMLRQ